MTMNNTNNDLFSSEAKTKNKQSSIFVTPSEVIEYLYCPRFIYFMDVLKIPQHEHKRFLVNKGREIHKLKLVRNKDYIRKKIGAIDEIWVCNTQKNDLEFINSLGKYGVPFIIVFTKADKISKNKLVHNVTLFKKAMLQDWEELPEMVITSAVTGQGRDQLLEIISSLNQDFDAFGRKQIKVKKEGKND